MIPNYIIKILKKQSFQTNLLSIFVNPFFFLRRGLFRHIKKNAKYLNGKMIDFGCGRKPYKNLFSIKEYIGVDIEVSGHPHENSEIDVFYDGKTLPFSNETFDSFFCSEVFEHVFNIEKIIKELNRVIKKGSTGLITIPFAWPEHEIPYDFARYTSFGIKDILEQNGFKVISLEKSGHFIECLIQLSILYIYSLFMTKNQFLNTLLTLIFISPLNIIGICISDILPKKQGLYHNLVVVVQKK